MSKLNKSNDELSRINFKMFSDIRKMKIKKQGVVYGNCDNRVIMYKG